MDESDDDEIAQQNQIAQRVQYVHRKRLLGECVDLIIFNEQIKIWIENNS